MRQIFQAYFGVGLGNFGWSIGQQTTFGVGATAGAGGAWYPTPQFAGLAFGNGGAPVSAGIGQAARSGDSRCHRVGRVRRPRRWKRPNLASTFRPIATPPSNALLNGVPMSNAASGRRSAGYVVKYGFRHAVPGSCSALPFSPRTRLRCRLTNHKANNDSVM